MKWGNILSNQINFKTEYMQNSIAHTFMIFPIVCKGMIETCAKKRIDPYKEQMVVHFHSTPTALPIRGCRIVLIVSERMLRHKQLILQLKSGNYLFGKWRRLLNRSVAQ